MAATLCILKFTLVIICVLIVESEDISSIEDRTPPSGAPVLPSFCSFSCQFHFVFSIFLSLMFLFLVCYRLSFPANRNFSTKWAKSSFRNSTIGLVIVLSGWADGGEGSCFVQQAPWK